MWKFIELEIEDGVAKTEALNTLKNDKFFHKRLRNEILMTVIPTSKKDTTKQAKIVYDIFKRVIIEKLTFSLFEIME